MPKVEVLSREVRIATIEAEERKTLGWDIRGNLAKLNYRIHTGFRLYSQSSGTTQRGVSRAMGLW